VTDKTEVTFENVKINKTNNLMNIVWVWGKKIA